MKILLKQILDISELPLNYCYSQIVFHYAGVWGLWLNHETTTD